MINSLKLKSRMVECEISQRELAKRIGVGLNHINEIINNKISPRISTVQKICIVLDIRSNKDKIALFFYDCDPYTEIERRIYERSIN